MMIALTMALAKLTCPRCLKAENLEPMDGKKESKFVRSSSSDWRTSLPQRLAGRSMLSQTRNGRKGRVKC